MAGLNERGASDMRMVFLGTAAGGHVSPMRGQSSLVVQLHALGELWMFDCAEATALRFTQFGKMTLSSITRIFITHMHPDHTLGLCGLISGLDLFKSHDRPLDIYGPGDLRELINTTLRLTHAHTKRPYRIHRLLREGEMERGPRLAQCEAEGGRDITAVDGVWTLFDEGGFSVRAASIKHTIPCFGFAMTEAPAAAPLDIKKLKPLIDRNADALAAAGVKKPMSLLNQLQKTREPITLPDGAVLQPSPLSKPGRKLVILGDTYDASGAQSIAMDADLVVHESTNAFLPTIPRFTAPEETLESVQAYSRERGHSTPEIAGAFAKSVNARALVLNHLSARYPPTNANQDVFEAIADSASSVFGRRAVVASDMMVLDIHRRSVEAEA